MGRFPLETVVRVDARSVWRVHVWASLVLEGYITVLIILKYYAVVIVILEYDSTVGDITTVVTIFTTLLEDYASWAIVLPLLVNVLQIFDFFLIATEIHVFDDVV